MTPIEQVLNAMQQGDKINARAILVSLVKVEPQNVDAWLLLSKILDDPEQVLYCQERAQTIMKDRFQNTEVTHQQSIIPGQSMKKCPYCAEMILVEAEVCRYCGRNINPKVMQAGIKMAQAAQLKTFSSILSQVGCWLMALGIALPCIVIFIGTMFSK